LKFVKNLKGVGLNGKAYTEKLIVVFNHNVLNLYFTESKSTMYASYHDIAYELPNP